MSRTPNYRFLAAFLIVLTAFSCWALYSVLGPELRPRQSAPPVGLAVDYQRLAAVSVRDGLSLPVAMDYVRSLGVDTLVIGEQTLAALADAGRVHLRWGWEIIDDWRTGAGPHWLPQWAGPDGTGPYGDSFAPWRLLIMPVDAQEGEWLFHALSRHWPGRVDTMAVPVPGEGLWLSVAVPKENPWAALQRKRRFHRYLWPENEQDLYPYHLLHHPLGYSPHQLQEATEAGFHVALRVEEPALEREDPQAFLGPGASLPPGTWLLVAPETIPAGTAGVEAAPVTDPGGDPGGDDPAGRWRDFMKDRRWHLGVVGSPRTAPARTLAAALPDDLMAVHPVWPEESPGDLVGRVTGSRVQVLYFQWFMTLTGREGDPAHLDQGYFRDLREGLQAAGRAPGLPLPAGGEAWGRGPDLPRSLGTVVVLAAALLGPWAALTVGMGVTARPPAPPLRAALAVAMAGAVSLGIGLLPAVLLRQPALMTGAVASPGVALAPLATLAAALWLELGARERGKGPHYQAGAGEPGTGWAWGATITFGHLLAVGAAVLLAGLAFLRVAAMPPGPAGPPGNGPGLMGLLNLTPLPFLETVLTVPALFLAFTQPWRRGEPGNGPVEGVLPWSPWPALLRMAGLVGQGAVIAALAHGQIPLTVTLAAACQGTVLGLLVGMLLHWAIGRWAEAGPLGWNGPALESGGGQP